MSFNNILTNSGVAEIAISYSQHIEHSKRIKVTTSKQAVEIFRYVWDEGTIELYESFMVILLNRNNRLNGVVPLAKGGITGTVVDIRLLFAIALKSASVSIIIAHNHPSGNLTPSEQDISMTKKVSASAELLDMKLLDHLIITKEGCFSFADDGML